RYNIFGNISLRQDYRPRLATDTRQMVDPSTGAFTYSEKRTDERGRPLTRIARIGVDYRPNEFSTVGAVVSYDYRSFRRWSIDRTIVRSEDKIIIEEFDRTRDAPEFEEDLEFST